VSLLSRRISSPVVARMPALFAAANPAFFGRPMTGTFG
jgi:hypothetical protein